jgi:hypothetical protein
MKGPDRQHKKAEPPLRKLLTTDHIHGECATPQALDLCLECFEESRGYHPHRRPRRPARISVACSERHGGAHAYTFWL